jgi:hypothetical protein
MYECIGVSMSIICISRVLAVVPDGLANGTLGYGGVFALFAFQPHVTTTVPKHLD